MGVVSEPRLKMIPIRAAKAIADEYGYDQVIVVARAIGDGEHVTTYGVDTENCRVAAKIGEFLKYRIMGWIRENEPLERINITTVSAE